MLDIGFWELLLVSVIALIFIGPEKLPEAIRTVTLWVGRFRRSLTNLRNEIENEIGADDCYDPISRTWVWSAEPTPVSGEGTIIVAARTAATWPGAARSRRNCPTSGSCAR